MLGGYMPTLTQWIMIVSALVVLGVGIYNHTDQSPDFSISVDPMQGQVEQGGVLQASVSAESIKGYDKSISISSTQQPAGIVTSFTPSVGKASYTSNLMINVDQSVSIGNYEIEVKGLGADGKVHSTYYKISVMPNAPLNTTPKPINQSNEQPIDVSTTFYPTGWIGDINDISFNGSNMENPYSGQNCIKIIYTPSGTEGWAGIYWQYPEKNWGDIQEGIDLSGRTKVTFFARGEIGGEKAEFKVGGINKEQYKDSIKDPISTGAIVLSKEWQQYTIDLTGQNLEHVIGGFCWVTSKSDNPSGCTIYLDDIVYE